MCSHWLLCVCSGELPSVDLRYYLVRHDDSDTKLRCQHWIRLTRSTRTHLIRKTHQGPQELGQMCLSGRKFPSSRKVRSVQARARVDNQKSEPERQLKLHTLQSHVAHRDSAIIALA
jgi:hypothetical protein